jgi:serine/threonine protein kinase
MIELDTKEYQYHLDENKRKFLETMVEVVVDRSTKINEGDNGVIMRVNLEDGEAKKIFDEVLPESQNTNLAAKMLKFFRPGAAGKEVELQTKSYAVIEQAEQSAEQFEYAKVPQVYIDETLDVGNPLLQQKLENMNVEVNDQHKVEVILMDFIDGVDFATYVDRLIVANHPGLVHLRECLKPGERWNYQEMHRAVAQALRFEEPAIKANKAERAYNEYKVFNERRQKMVDFLKSNNITIDPGILTKVKNTVNLLHNNGIYHHDLHERNIMMTFSDEAKTKMKDVYIVDFGRATQYPKQSQPNDEFMRDEAVVANYRTLQTTEGEDELIKNQLTIEKWGKLVDIMSKVQLAKFNSLETSLATMLESQTVDKNLVLGWMSEMDVEEFLAILWKIAEKHDHEQISKLVENILEFAITKKRPPFIINKLREYLEIF